MNLLPRRRSCRAMSLLVVARPSIFFDFCATAPGLGSRLSVAQDVDAPPGRPENGPTQLTFAMESKTTSGAPSSTPIFALIHAAPWPSLSTQAYLPRPQDSF